MVHVPWTRSSLCLPWIYTRRGNGRRGLAGHRDEARVGGVSVTGGQVNLVKGGGGLVGEIYGSSIGGLGEGQLDSSIFAIYSLRIAPVPSAAISSSVSSWVATLPIVVSVCLFPRPKIRSGFTNGDALTNVILNK